MNYAERLYDSQLEPREEPVTYPVCPLCGATLDSDDDEINTDIDDYSAITGCSHCEKSHNAQKWWAMHKEDEVNEI